MISKHSKYSHDGAAAISEVDQRLRQCLQILWLALPRGQMSAEELEFHFDRLVGRSMRDFKEDLEFFPPKNDR